MVPFLILYICNSVISGFMARVACNSQPPPHAPWLWEGPRHYGQQGQHLTATFHPLSLICLPCLVLITVRETEKEGEMQRSLTALLSGLWCSQERRRGHCWGLCGWWRWLRWAAQKRFTPVVPAYGVLWSAAMLAWGWGNKSRETVKAAVRRL